MTKSEIMAGVLERLGVMYSSIEGDEVQLFFDDASALLIKITREGMSIYGGKVTVIDDNDVLVAASDTLQ